MHTLLLCLNIPCVAINIYFQKIFIFIGGFASFLGLFNQSIINSTDSLSGTFVNSDTTSKLTFVCFLLKLHFLSSLTKCSVDLSKYRCPAYKV